MYLILILIIEIMLVLVYSTVLTLLMLYAILTFNNFIFEQACTSAYFCWHLSQKSNVLKVSKFQNDFLKSSFLPKYERKIVKISALTTQGRNPDNFSFVFWEKR